MLLLLLLLLFYNCSCERHRFNFPLQVSLVRFQTCLRLIEKKKNVSEIRQLCKFRAVKGSILNFYRQRDAPVAAFLLLEDILIPAGLLSRAISDLHSRPFARQFVLLVLRSPAVH